MNNPSTRPLSAEPAALWAIADVERETGIGKDTLRVWERRYGFPVPRRDERGDRLYDADQLGRLRLIKRLLDAGHRPGRVVGLPREALEALGAAVEVPQSLADQAACPPNDALAEWMAWLRTDQTHRLREGLRETVRTQGLAHAVESVVAPLCVEVGNAWLRGELGVYQEHLFTEAVQATLREGIALTEGARLGGPVPPRVLLTTAPGEPHQLGLLMAECFLALEGVDRLPLGVSTPVADIVDAAQRTQADVVALSYSAYAGRRDVLDTVSHLRERLPATVELWAGGAGAVQHLRRPPGGVWVLGRATDVARQVQRWRVERGRAN